MSVQIQFVLFTQSLPLSMLLNRNKPACVFITVHPNSKFCKASHFLMGRIIYQFKLCLLASFFTSFNLKNREKRTALTYNYVSVKCI